MVRSFDGGSWFGFRPVFRPVGDCCLQALWGVFGPWWGNVDSNLQGPLVGSTVRYAASEASLAGVSSGVARLFRGGAFPLPAVLLGQLGVLAVEGHVFLEVRHLPSGLGVCRYEPRSMGQVHL